jgi:hypothetical protein
MSDTVKNLPVSIHDRLKNLAKREGRPFQEFFYYYSIERFLYRLSRCCHKERFVLKGGLMFSRLGHSMVFLKRSLLSNADNPPFNQVIEILGRFLWPVLQVASS